MHPQAAIAVAVSADDGCLDYAVTFDGGRTSASGQLTAQTADVLRRHVEILVVAELSLLPHTLVTALHSQLPVAVLPPASEHPHSPAAVLGAWASSAQNPARVLEAGEASRNFELAEFHALLDERQRLAHDLAELHGEMRAHLRAVTPEYARLIVGSTLGVRRTNELLRRYPTARMLQLADPEPVSHLLGVPQDPMMQVLLDGLLALGPEGEPESVSRIETVVPPLAQQGALLIARIEAVEAEAYRVATSPLVVAG